MSKSTSDRLAIHADATTSSLEVQAAIDVQELFTAFDSFGAFAIRRAIVPPAAQETAVSPGALPAIVRDAHRAEATTI